MRTVRGSPASPTTGAQFRRQVPLDGRFVVDFVASEVGLIVEVDGTGHANRAHRDERRDRRLARRGFSVMRIPARLVETNLPDALQRIRAAIASARAKRQ